VHRIQFASSGFTDLAGLGTIVGHRKDFLLRLIEIGTTGEQRRLQNEQREETVQKMRIANARELANPDGDRFADQLEHCSGAGCSRDPVLIVKPRRRWLAE
jgi:hypothetical protein